MQPRTIPTLRKISKCSLNVIVSEEDGVPQGHFPGAIWTPPPSALPAEQFSTGLKLPNPIFRWLPKAG